uniref:Transmembrane protein 72 n=1 Tax=Steinernema glaseri TaxID=37863 RepID=A0A1I7YL94_9BILA
MDVAPQHHLHHSQIISLQKFQQNFELALKDGAVIVQSLFSCAIACILFYLCLNKYTVHVWYFVLSTLCLAASHLKLRFNGVLMGYL